MASKHGCFDREPLEGRSYPVQDGWTYQSLGATGMTRIPVIKDQPFVMKPECQYSQLASNMADSDCQGCIRKWTGDAIQPV